MDLPQGTVIKCEVDSSSKTQSQFYPVRNLLNGFILLISGTIHEENDTCNDIFFQRNDNTYPYIFK